MPSSVRCGRSPRSTITRRPSPIRPLIARSPAKSLETSDVFAFASTAVNRVPARIRKSTSICPSVGAHYHKPSKGWPVPLTGSP